MTQPTTTAAQWGGWYRPSKRDRWARLVAAADYHEAWGKLLDATARTPSGAELLVSLDDPNHERSTR